MNRAKKRLSTIRHMTLVGGFAFLLAVTATSASASTFGTNWTHMVFDANVGEVVFFDYDQDSQWQIVIPDPNNPVTVNDSEIVMGSTPIGTVYQFTIPNFFDPLPVKNIEVIMDGNNPTASGSDLPFVMDIIGGDSDFDNGGPALPVFGVFDNAIETSTNVVEYWHMLPNPDFETVKLFVPAAFELQTINIWTESVPEPTTLALLGLGGLVLVRRRR